MVQEVLNGTVSLDEALKIVETARTQAEGKSHRMERLRGNAPDLADLVAEERMSLSEATSAWTKREEHRRVIYRVGANALGQLIEFAAT